MLNLKLHHFDHNIDKCWPSLAKYLAKIFILYKIVKNAIFALRCEIAIVKLRLHFNLVRKQLRNKKLLCITKKIPLHLHAMRYIKENSITY